MLFLEQLIFHHIDASIFNVDCLIVLYSEVSASFHFSHLLSHSEMNDEKQKSYSDEEEAGKIK